METQEPFLLIMILKLFLTMKKIIIILSLFLTIIIPANSQAMFTDYYLYDTTFTNNNNSDSIISMTTRSGIFTIQSSCASPTGSMNVTIITPPSYPWLQSNGYCRPSNYGSNGTVCWTFTPTQSNVSINSGYAITGCATASFGSFNMYTCAPACVPSGTGLVYTLVPGQCYTWCMSYSASGPPACQFTDFCPYYTQSGSLPVELVYFIGYNQNKINNLEWLTATEVNCDYFLIERSVDGILWEEIGRVEGSGNSNAYVEYGFSDLKPIPGYNYYRLKQVDYNGVYKYYGVVSCLYDTNYTINVIKTTNIMGQEVSDEYEGLRIIYYSDGTVVRKIGK